MTKVKDVMILGLTRLFSESSRLVILLLLIIGTMTYFGLQGLNYAHTELKLIDKELTECKIELNGLEKDMVSLERQLMKYKIRNNEE